MEAVLESQQDIKKARKEVENLIYKIMDILDPSNENSSCKRSLFYGLINSFMNTLNKNFQ